MVSPLATLLELDAELALDCADLTACNAFVALESVSLARCAVAEVEAEVELVVVLLLLEDEEEELLLDPKMLRASAVIVNVTTAPTAATTATDGNIFPMSQVDARMNGYF
ncbi:MAG: hypothetical protein ACFUZC_22330 [Chthoniobacteraceae bacterium]